MRAEANGVDRLWPRPEVPVVADNNNNSICDWIDRPNIGCKINTLSAAILPLMPAGSSRTKYLQFNASTIYYPELS